MTCLIHMWLHDIIMNYNLSVHSKIRSEVDEGQDCNVPSLLWTVIETISTPTADIEQTLRFEFYATGFCNVKLLTNNMYMFILIGKWKS